MLATKRSARAELKRRGKRSSLLSIPKYLYDSLESRNLRNTPKFSLSNFRETSLKGKLLSIGDNYAQLALPVNDQYFVFECNIKYIGDTNIYLLIGSVVNVYCTSIDSSGRLMLEVWDV